MDKPIPAPRCPTAYIGAEASYVWAAAWEAGVQAALTAAQQQGGDPRPFGALTDIYSEHKRAAQPARTAPPSAPVRVDGLPRYGFPDGNEPRPVPCADGYWTPWHLAQQPAAVDGSVVIDGRRYDVETVRTALLGLAAGYATQHQEPTT